MSTRVEPRAWIRWAAALLLAGALAGCAARARPATTPDARPAVVHDLGTLADLTSLFDRDRDHPRIVLLLSPT